MHQPLAFLPLQGTNLVRRFRSHAMRREILAGARASRAVIVQTKQMGDAMRRFDRSLSDRIHVISSGWRTPPSAPQIRPTVAAAVDGATGPRMIYVTHPSEHKNHVSLVRAIPGITQSWPEATLLLTLDRQNPPNGRYARFVRQIERAAEDCNVAERLLWLGILGPDEVDYSLRRSDVLVFPSLAESFGLALVEAMAAGCPIAAADLPYAHDVAGDAAAYFDPRAPEDIAATVASLLDDPQHLARLRSMGAQRKGIYAYQSIAARLTDVLQASVATARKTPSTAAA